MYRIIYSTKANSDAKKIYKSYLKTNCEMLLEIIRLDPYHTPPPFEKLSGDLSGLYSRRINAQHRLVYEIDEQSKLIKVHRMWTHYE